MPVKQYGVFLLMFLAIAQPMEKKKIFMAGDSTMAIKAPTAYPETGWGMPFAGFWDSATTVVNLAKNGRSTRTFISEGLWQKIMDEARTGDYVFIQFGHNDESPDKKDRYTSPDSFKINLSRFIRETKLKSAIPVLFTPVGRRRFDTGGKVMETHVEYSALVREVAMQESVIWIDLDSISREIYQRYGKEHSRMLFLQLKPGEHPNYPEGKDDNTHFNELGARLIAQAVLQEIREKIPELAAHIYRPKK